MGGVALGRWEKLGVPTWTRTQVPVALFFGVEDTSVDWLSSLKIHSLSRALDLGTSEVHGAPLRNGSFDQHDEAESSATCKPSRKKHKQ